MNYKIIYQEAGLYIEATANSEAERKDVVKGIIYTTKDIKEGFSIKEEKTPESVAVCDDSGQDLNNDDEPITEGQIRFAKKYKIDLSTASTMKEAWKVIYDWKVLHGWKV